MAIMGVGVSKHSHSRSRYAYVTIKLLKNVLIVAKWWVKGENGGLMNTALTIEAIADWFLHKEPMTHKKLQKLCYYTMAWGWTLMERSVANRGQFQAWVHGPVSPVLYKKYKAHGWNQLAKVKDEPSVPTDVKELLEAVWLTYGKKSGNELEALSHSEKPWIEARNGLAPDELCQNVISPDVMKVYYNSIKSSDY